VFVLRLRYTALSASHYVLLGFYYCSQFFTKRFLYPLYRPRDC